MTFDIQKAIDDAANGGVIVIPPGRHVLKGTLRLSKNVQIQGGKVCPVCQEKFLPKDKEEWERKTYCSRLCWQGGRA